MAKARKVPKAAPAPDTKTADVAFGARPNVASPTVTIDNKAGAKMGKEKIIFVRDRERSPERVVASFPPDADQLLITAAMVAEILRAQASGLSVHDLKFRVAREPIKG